MTTTRRRFWVYLLLFVFSAIAYVDRVMWNFVPDPGTASVALDQGEIDWW